MKKAGRVVVFPGDRRNRGYVVKSESKESRIRSFLKMFFYAHISILLLGNFLAMEWSRELNHALGRPTAHLYRADPLHFRALMTQTLQTKIQGKSQPEGSVAPMHKYREADDINRQLQLDGRKKALQRWAGNKDSRGKKQKTKS